MLQFHWVKDKDRSKVQTFQFARVVFGLNQSPFILGATVEEHLRSLCGNNTASFLNGQPSALKITSDKCCRVAMVEVVKTAF